MKINKRNSMRYISELISQIEEEIDQKWGKDLLRQQRLQDVLGRVMFSGLVQGRFDPRNIRQLLEERPDIVTAEDLELFNEVFKLRKNLTMGVGQ